MLTSDSLLERWDALTARAGGYTRIDSVHPLELYIGYEETGNRSLLLVTSTEPPPVPSSKSVRVSVGQRHDGRWSVSFRLVEHEQDEVFMQLCYDLIESSRNRESGDEGTAYFLDRYRLWHKLMERQSTSLLSEASRKGLMGELLFLRQVLHDGMTPVDAVAGWMGPEHGHQDFVFTDSWYEVKTVGASAKTVTISSLQQLDVRSTGELVVFFMDRTAPGDSSGFSLNEMVLQLRDQLRHSTTALELFNSKLTFDFGYVANRVYDTPVYRLSTSGRYVVDRRFPRLTRDNVPVQVTAASYELSLNAIADWKKE